MDFSLIASPQAAPAAARSLLQECCPRSRRLPGPPPFSERGEPEALLRSFLRRAFSVVGHREAHALRPEGQQRRHPAGPGVLEGVGQTFLQGAVEDQLGFARELLSEPSTAKRTSKPVPSKERASAAMASGAALSSVRAA